MSSDLSAFLSDKCVLITGGTGFVGKALVEKILRSVPDVKTVFLLLRPKSGQTAEKRLKQLLANSVFDAIRRLDGQQLAKVVAVCGDVTHEELGLNPLDRHALQDAVHVVFNCAATIRFDEPLRRALQLNVVSAQRLLRLVQSFARIEAVVHVSTAYCTRDKRDVRESVEAEGVSVERLLDASEWLEAELLEGVAKRQLFGERHSSYHFTKSLAEGVFA
ncbi:unnamed protein product, partial [Oppiella nova]